MYQLSHFRTYSEYCAHVQREEETVSAFESGEVESVTDSPARDLISPNIRGDRTSMISTIVEVRPFVLFSEYHSKHSFDMGKSDLSSNKFNPMLHLSDLVPILCEVTVAIVCVQPHRRGLAGLTKGAGDRCESRDRCESVPLNSSDGLVCLLCFGKQDDDTEIQAEESQVDEENFLAMSPVVRHQMNTVRQRI